MLRKGASTAAHLGSASLRLTAVTIRPATEHDRPALERLAERDTSAVPPGALLLAERGGVVEAALSLDSGESIADPFERTAELVDLLRAHAKAGGDTHSPRPRRLGLMPRLVGGAA